MQTYPTLLGHSAAAKYIGCTKQAFTGRRKRGTVPEPYMVIDGRPFWTEEQLKPYRKKEAKQ